MAGIVGLTGWIGTATARATRSRRPSRPHEPTMQVHDDVRITLGPAGHPFCLDQDE